MTTRSAVQATSDLYGTSPLVRLFRVGLGASQHLWPQLAVRAATHLFATPLPPRWLQRHRPWEPQWRVEAWPFEQAGLTLYTRPFAPPGPAVLLVHGWGGHARQLLPLAEAVAGQGLQPVLVDMPAHGRSEGSTSNLPQFARAIDYVVARLQQQGVAIRAVVGHSLGASATAYAASRGLAAERLVLLAPVASPREYTRLFAQVFGLSEAIRAGLQARIEAREAILMTQFEPQAAGPRVAAPALVVHDRGDRINRFADGQAFARAIPQARLLATDNLGHRRLLKDDAVLREVAAFLR